MLADRQSTFSNRSGDAMDRRHHVVLREPQHGPPHAAHRQIVRSPARGVPSEITAVPDVVNAVGADHPVHGRIGVAPITAIDDRRPRTRTEKPPKVTFSDRGPIVVMTSRLGQRGKRVVAGTGRPTLRAGPVCTAEVFDEGQRSAVQGFPAEAAHEKRTKTRCA